MKSSDHFSASPISTILEEKAEQAWWWHRLTLSPEAYSLTTAVQREAGRRARFLSTVVFCLMLVICILIPATLFIANRYVMLICFVMLGICLLALWCNRANKVLFASVLTVGMLEAALICVIVTTTPFDVPNLPLYDLLLMTVLFAASLLPPTYIVLIAAVNVLFMLGHLYLARNASGIGTLALQQYLQTQFYAALIRPTALEIIVGVVAALWVRSTTQAINRANRAELIARLEHAVAQQKEQLQQEIQQILQTYTEVANGDLSARSPLSHDTLLWPLANALNTLLSRHQQLAAFEMQQKRLEQVLQALLRALQEAEQKQQPLPNFPHTSTSIDFILRQLAGKYVSSPSDSKIGLRRGKPAANLSMSKES